MGATPFFALNMNESADEEGIFRNKTPRGYKRAEPIEGRRSGMSMKTGEMVGDLALYASSCCSYELLFDTEDTFARCPKCEGQCQWNLLERVVSWEELDDEDLELPR